MNKPPYNITPPTPTYTIKITGDYVNIPCDKCPPHLVNFEAEGDGEYKIEYKRKLIRLPLFKGSKVDVWLTGDGNIYVGDIKREDDTIQNL